MCGLCRMLAGVQRGGPETSPFDRADGVAPARQERQKRVRLLNQVVRHYGVTLDDFAGNAFVLRSATGRTELVPSLGVLWPAVERVSGRLCDPFDPALLAALARAPRRGPAA